MTPKHLSSRQITEALLGSASSDAETHMSACAVCRDKLDRMRSDLALFGGAVRMWSEAQLRDIAVVSPSSRPRFSFPRVALAGVVFASLLLALFVGVPSQLRRAQHMDRSDVSASDAALLQQIDAELSRTVPQPMEPLNQLVAVEGSKSNPRSKKDEGNGGSLSR